MTKNGNYQPWGVVYPWANNELWKELLNAKHTNAGPAHSAGQKIARGTATYEGI